MKISIFHVARSYAAACVSFRLCFLCVGDVFLAHSGSVLNTTQCSSMQACCYIYMLNLVTEVKKILYLRDDGQSVTETCRRSFRVL